MKHKMQAQPLVISLVEGKELPGVEQLAAFIKSEGEAREDSWLSGPVSIAEL